MKLKFISCLVLLLFLADVGLSKEPEWLKKMKQIKLLSDTREDVIKLLGNPVGNDKENYSWYYDFDDGRMSILYSIGICKTSGQKGLQGFSGWKVSEWTVVDISFFPNEEIDPKVLGINFKSFIAKPIYHVRGGIEYVNDTLGIDYTVYEGKIQDITFRPAKKYDYLRCKESDVK